MQRDLARGGLGGRVMNGTTIGWGLRGKFLRFCKMDKIFWCEMGREFLLGFCGVFACYLVLEDATVFLDDACGGDVVGVAGYEYAVES